MARRTVRPLGDRFWSKVNKSAGPDGCWIWTASTKTEDGYGRINRGRHNEGKVLTHRLSWELHNGPVPRGMMVCHSCDNPPCVNPRHLWLGTNKDNMRDCRSKGRKAVGEKVGGATATAADIREIRRRYADGETVCALATLFHRSSGNVSLIVHGKIWKHLLQ